MAIAVSTEKKIPNIDDVVYDTIKNKVKGDKNVQLPISDLIQSLPQYKEKEIQLSLHSLASADKICLQHGSKKDNTWYTVNIK